MSNPVSKIWMIVIVLLSSVSSFAQISNSQTETVKIYGNCDMCKATIEKAGNIKKVAAVAWNEKTKMAEITYNSKETNTDEILKRIALAGYDNEKFLAPDDVYAKLPECCHYDRALKPVAKSHGHNAPAQNEHSAHNHAEMGHTKEMAKQNATELKAVFDNYFLLKDALVKTDAGAASSNAAQLAKAIKAVEMTKLSTGEHTVWMNVMKELTANTEKVAEAKDISKQREGFVLLSKSMYDLAKVSKQDVPVYYQHCPMYNNGKGANWLSKQSAIKNPFYGAQMMTCGSTVETIFQ